MAEPNFVDKTIWTGDNLDILRGMNSETVDLIYLDPPFNSNKTYEAPVGSKAAGAAFKDTWSLSDLDVAWMGLIADEHPAIAYMLDAAGKAHGKGMQSYLTMMAARLLEMRRVLKPTGSIYLHCDPFASHYLKPGFPILGVFRLKGQSKRDGSIIVRSCKASLSPVYPIRDAFLAVNHASCPSLSSSGPRQWGESALKTSRLPGALSLLAKSWLYPPSAWRRR